MKKNNILFLFLLVFLINLSIFPQIRIILSAALPDAYFEVRKQQYITSFNILAKYGYKDVYVV